MCYSLIRLWRSGRTACALLSLVIAIPVPSPAQAENLPDMRPALIGSGPHALINLIDAKGLVQRGQGHGAIRIVALVRPNGSTVGSRVYGGTPGTDKLKWEVRNCLRRSQFIPAVHDHQNVYAYFYGTVMLGVIDGKPRLRIFANQELSELEKESDYIQPQSFYLPNHYYEPQKYPEKSWASEDMPTVVVLREAMDASGKMKDIQVEKEMPPGGKRGESAVKVVKQLTFIPAFRNGRPVDSVTHVNFVFVPAGWASK